LEEAKRHGSYKEIIAKEIVEFVSEHRTQVGEKEEYGAEVDWTGAEDVIERIAQQKVGITTGDGLVT
jgi:hypothetical protein